VTSLAEKVATAAKGVFDWLSDEVTKAVEDLSEKAGQIERDATAEVEKQRVNAEAIVNAGVTDATRIAGEQKVFVETTVESNKSFALGVAEQQKVFAEGKLVEAVQLAQDTKTKGVEIAQQRIAEAKATAAKAVVTLDEAKTSAVTAAGTTIRAVASDGQAATESALGTATAAPGTVMTTVINTATEFKQTWDETAAGVTAPDLEGPVGAGVKAAEDLLGGTTAGGAMGGALK